MIMEIRLIKKSIKSENIYIKKLNVAAYVRVSTKKDEQKSSFVNQYSYYKHFICKNNNWNFIGIYSDYGKTGKTTILRDGFKELINDALNGKIDLIYTKSISRFARNTEDFLRAIRMLKSKNIGVIFEEEGINTLNLGGEMLISVLAAVAQKESENISSRIISGFEHSMKLGDSGATARGLGYEIIRGKFRIIEEEAVIVKLIFDLYVSGKNKREICKLLIESGNKMNSWIPTRLNYILKNPIYTGDLVRGRNKYIKIKSKYVIRNHHPAIIDREIFEKAQLKLSKNKVHLITDENLKNGYCWICKRKLKVVKNTNGYNKVYRYFQCNRECSFTLLDTNIVKLLFKEALIKIVSMKINKKYSNLRKCCDLKMKLQNDKNIVTDKYINEKINLDKYKIEINELNKELEKVNVRIKRLEENQSLLKQKNKVKDDIFKIIFENTNSLNEFNLDLYYKIVTFCFIGDKKNNNYIRFYYDNHFYFFDEKRKNLFEFTKEFVRLLKFKYIREITYSDNRRSFQREYIVEFYIRKD